MEVIQYIPLSAALAQVYPFINQDMVEEDEIEEWASFLMGKLQVRQTYDESIVVLRVQNHKANLPRGVKYIEQVFYKELLNQEDILLIELYHQQPDASTNTKKFLEFNSIGEYFSNTWKPVRASTSLFNKAVHCNNSINLYVKCEAEYSVSKNFVITTSFENGYLAVGYLSYPMNEDKEFLIPDDEDVLEALRSGILMYVWEKQTNFGIENSYQLWKDYESKWEILAAKARGKLLLPGIDQLQNLKDQIQRIGQHQMNYFTAFGNLGTAENIKF